MLLTLLGCALFCAPDVVELKDGTRLVGEIVADAAKVSLRTSLGVIEVPALQVERTTRRAELLPLYRKLAASATGRLHAWLTIADWSLAHGLYGEAFDAVDRAAALSPGDPAVADATALLTRDGVLDQFAPIDVPAGAARIALLEHAGGESATRAAFARAALARIAAPEREEFLLDALTAARPETRIGASMVLGDLQSDRGLAQLIRVSLLDENAHVRAAAREAAARSRHPDLASPYLKAVETGDQRMRERSYPMLEMLRDPRAVPALIAMLKPRPVAPAGGGPGYSPPHANIFIGQQRAYVRDFDVEIAQGAVIAKPIVGILQSGAALDVAVGGVVVISYVERLEVVSALRHLSGQNLGPDPAAWESWWAQSGGRLPPVTVSGKS
jgi:hypothetical protein